MRVEEQLIILKLLMTAIPLYNCPMAYREFESGSSATPSEGCAGSHGASCGVADRTARPVIYFPTASRLSGARSHFVMASLPPGSKVS